MVVDPFLAPNNPVATVSADELDATHILVTHGHADHIADAVAVAQKNDAPTAWRSSSSPAGSASRASRTPSTPTSAARSSSTGAG